MTKVYFSLCFIDSTMAEFTNFDSCHQVADAPL